MLPRKTKSMPSAQPTGPGESSPDIVLNHLDAEGLQSKAMGATSRSAITPAITAPSSDVSDTIAPSKKSEKTTVFGTRNHPLRPRRSDKTIPSDSRSGNEPHRTNGQTSPSWSIPKTCATISTMIHTTDSATYIQPSTSTILTGSGFFISGTVYQKSVSSRARK